MTLQKLGVLLRFIFSGLLILTHPTVGLAAPLAQSVPTGQAGLVIVQPDREPLTFCLSTDDETTGVQLLEQTGVDFIADYGNSLGAAICRVDDVGCAFPSQECFCQCQGATCTYWSYHHLPPDGEEWIYAQFGAGQNVVEPGSVEAWVWSSGDSTSTQIAPPDVTFADICLDETGNAPTGPAQAEPVNWIAYLGFAALLVILLAGAILRRRTTN